MIFFAKPFRADAAIDLRPREIIVRLVCSLASAARYLIQPAVALLLLGLLVCTNISAQTVDTIVKAGLFEPYGVVSGNDGYLYVTESAFNRIVRVEFGSGKTSLLTGGVAGVADGNGSRAQFFNPRGVILARNGIVVADSGNHSIRLVSFEGVVTTIAGNSGTPGFVDDSNPLNARFRFPVGLAVDDDGNIYVADSKNSAVRRIAPGGKVVTVAGAGDGLFEPAALAWEPTGNRLWIADTRNHSIKFINLTTGGKPVIAAGGDAPFLAGNEDSVNGLSARFSSPRGLLWAGSSTGILVADSGNNAIRRIFPSGSGDGFTVTTYAGVSDESAQVDGPLSVSRFQSPIGLARHAESGAFLVIDGSGGAVRRITPANAGGGNQGGGTPVVVNPPDFAPKSGYYPTGVKVRVFSQTPNVYFTTDGTVPTLASKPVTIQDGTGIIEWRESTKDLSFLRVRAFVGTNASSVTSGSASLVNEIGVPRETLGGIGSTVVIPVVANLVPKQAMRSVQFRVEVVPQGDAPVVSDQFKSLPVVTNGFVNLVTPNEINNVASISSSSYLLGKARGLAVSAIGTNANLFVENYAVVALLAVPIPPTAKLGDQYSIRVLESSATSDGVQDALALSSMPVQTIVVSNLTYLVGDSSPGGWYNAGDFGNGDLNNNDVNNAFYAALGIRLPFTFSDAFDAMDVFPIDSVNSVGGDGEIRFLDWQRILRRALKLDTNNWVRSWSEGGFRLSTGSEIKSRSSARQSRSQAMAVRGAGWTRQAAIGTVPHSTVNPGDLVSIPVFVKVAKGASLSGLLMNIVVQPSPGSPDLVGGVHFRPAEGVPSGTPASFNQNSVGYGWNVGAFVPPIVGSNVLGYLEFKVPDLARATDSYKISFSKVDGAPDLDTQYDLESYRSQVWVISEGAVDSTGMFSDEWLAKFFGGAGNQPVLPGADSDGDGLSNSDEFVAGTDPTAVESRLVVEVRKGTGPGVVVRWSSISGKFYAVERAASLVTPVWSPVASGISGKAGFTEYEDTRVDGGPAYYRVKVEQ